MRTAQYKGLMAEPARAAGHRSERPFSPRVRERRRRLIASINAGHSAQAEKAEAVLSKYLDDIYPQTELFG